MRAMLTWVIMSLGVGTVIALIRMAVYAYLYRRVRRVLRGRPRQALPRAGAEADPADRSARA